LEFHLRWNILYKWFCGYPLFALGPDHCTLHNFNAYLMQTHPRIFFDTLLGQIDDDFPHDRKRPQIGDTFALHADAALENLIRRLRHTNDKLLTVLEAVAPELSAQLLPQLDVSGLLGEEHEKADYFLSPAEWQQRFHITVVATQQSIALLTPHTIDLPPVQKWLDIARKILADEVIITLNAQGEISRVKKLPQKERGSYRICSATDPDATIRNHGPNKQEFGYNISLATTTCFIREIRADTGSQPDPVAIPDLLSAQQEHHQLLPEKLIYDQAAGEGKYFATVTELSGGQTRLVAKPKREETNSDHFGPQDFSLSQDAFSLTCPHGRVTWRKYRAGSGDGFTFRFVSPQCLGVPAGAVRPHPPPPAMSLSATIPCPWPRLRRMPKQQPLNST